MRFPSVPGVRHVAARSWWRRHGCWRPCPRSPWACLPCCPMAWCSSAASRPPVGNGEAGGEGHRGMGRPHRVRDRQPLRPVAHRPAGGAAAARRHHPRHSGAAGEQLRIRNPQLWSGVAVRRPVQHGDAAQADRPGESRGPGPRSPGAGAAVPGADAGRAAAQRGRLGGGFAGVGFRLFGGVLPDGPHAGDAREGRRGPGRHIRRRHRDRSLGSRHRRRHHQCRRPSAARATVTPWPAEATLSRRW